MTAPLALRIRTAQPSDAAAIAAIYRPIVNATAISFEEQAPSDHEMAQRITAANDRHRWLLAESAGRIAGYAYATGHRARSAYRFSAETSVYVDPACHGQGIGAALYRRLFEELAARGFYHAYAGIALPNDASIRLHVSAGFEHVGTFPMVGFKFGRWHDVAWWHKTVQPGVPHTP